MIDVVERSTEIKINNLVETEIFRMSIEGEIKTATVTLRKTKEKQKDCKWLQNLKTIVWNLGVGIATSVAVAKVKLFSDA